MIKKNFIFSVLTKSALAFLLVLSFACSSDDSTEPDQEEPETEEPVKEEPKEEEPVKEEPKEEEPVKPRIPEDKGPGAPLSDPENTGGWILNTEVSDEFEGAELNLSKWKVQSMPGNSHSAWIGRPPSQFSPDNLRVENGKLILETRWEPDYNFSDNTDGGRKYENITTAAVITKKTVLYGYMEAKFKAADAEITSSFWATGGNTEFDFCEIFGDHRQPKKESEGRDNELWWSIHDWSVKGPEGESGPTTYTERVVLNGKENTPNIRWADDFNIVGFDWSPEGVKIYLNGELFRDLSKEDINNYDDSIKDGNGAAENYVITKPLSIWFDQETFPWHGEPISKADLERNSPEGKKDDGVVDFEIEYLRVWQKPAQMAAAK